MVLVTAGERKHSCRRFRDPVLRLSLTLLPSSSSSPPPDTAGVEKDKKVYMSLKFLK